MIMLPSSANDFANPEIAGYIEKTQHSPATDCAGPGKVLQAGLGCGGLGVRLASSAVRDVLCRARIWSLAATPSAPVIGSRQLGMVDQFMSTYDLQGHQRLRGTVCHTIGMRRFARCTRMLRDRSGDYYAARNAGEHVGVTVNSFASLSLDPPLILFSLGKNSQGFRSLSADGVLRGQYSRPRTGVSLQYVCAALDRLMG